MKDRGVRLQGEWASALKRYDTRPQLIQRPVSQEPILGDYVTDHFTWSWYALIAYELPLEKYIGSHLITPFFWIDAVVPTDAAAMGNALNYRFGINYKPNYFLTLKVEGSRLTLDIESQRVENKMWTLAGQVAVAF